uniref:Uncharacterized protein n=1 Tax=Rhizophagus irregularis (strain DAOM 181602 / DAOM 197198 / MUCL 43194) TaxID=747089 RepID=U9UP08_RHIID
MFISCIVTCTLRQIPSLVTFYGLNKESMDKTLSIDEVNEELNDNKCERCCYECNVKFFQRNFENWTSGNSNIDKLIQDTQLLAHKDSEIPSALEWISYDRLDDIKYIEKFGIYRANRIDGRIQLKKTMSFMG